MRELGKRGFSAVAWGSLGALVRMALQLAAQVVLARILGPEQYGIFAIGVIVISFSNFLADSGLAYGLIQKAQIDSRDLRFVWTWQLILGSLVAGAVWLLSATLAAFFSEPRAEPLLQALAWVCLLSAMAAPAMNLLKRELRYRDLQLANLFAYAVGFYLVGIPLAMAGAQVWALAAAWLTQAALLLVLLYLCTRHPLSALLWYEGAAAQARYAGKVLITNLLNWALSNMDRVIVGRNFPSRDMGLYANAYNLVSAPGSALAGAVQPVFLSLASRMSDGPQRIAAGLRGGIAAVAAVALPAFALMAVLAQPLVALILGERWIDSAPLMAPMALAMPMWLLLALSTPVLWTQDRHSREFTLQLPLLVLGVAACYLAAKHSLGAVAWALLGVHTARGVTLCWFACRAVSVSAAAVWHSTRGGLLLAMLSVGAVLAADTALQTAALAPGWRLLTGAMLAKLVWLVAARLWPGLLCQELRVLLSLALARLPRPLAQRLSYLGDRTP